MSLPNPDFILASLKTAAYERNVDRLRWYIEHIDQMNMQYDSRRPIHALIDVYESAAAGGSAECAQLILDHVPERQDCHHALKDVLIQSKLKNIDLKFVEMLLVQRRDYVETDRALLDAVFADNREAVELLMKHGSNVNWGGGELVCRAVFQKHHDLALWLADRIDLPQWRKRVVEELFFNHSAADERLWTRLYDRELIEHLIEKKGGVMTAITNPAFRADHEARVLNDHVAMVDDEHSQRAARARKI